MKILIDTNILISAVSKEDGLPNKVLRFISRSSKYDIYLTDQNLIEFKEVINRKMPNYVNYVSPFLNKLDYEVIIAIENSGEAPEIRDEDDRPILNAAIINDLDIILTGDKDFLTLELDRPKCMSPAQFCELENIP